MLSSDGSKVDVLLVEDDDHFARLLQEYFKLYKAVELSCTVARSLGDAVTALETVPFDIVVSDLGLPDSQGLQTIDGIMAVAPTTPLVVLTGRDDVETGVEAVRRGVSDYLVKARVDDDNIVRAVLYALDRTNTANAIGDQMAFQQQLIDAVPIPVFYIDAQAAIIGCNTQFEALFDISRFDLLGQTYRDVLPPGLTEEVKGQIDGVAASDFVLLGDVGPKACSDRFKVRTVALDGDAGVVVSLIPLPKASEDSHIGPTTS